MRKKCLLFNALRLWYPEQIKTEVGTDYGVLLQTPTNVAGALELGNIQRRRVLRCLLERADTARKELGKVILGKCSHSVGATGLATCL